MAKEIFGPYYEEAVRLFQQNPDFFPDPDKCTIQIPPILSNSSGIKCPVSYGKKIDGEIIKELYEYVATISNMKWEKGGKRFYKHKI